MLQTHLFLEQIYVNPAYILPPGERIAVNR